MGLEYQKLIPISNIGQQKKDFEKCITQKKIFMFIKTLNLGIL